MVAGTTQVKNLQPKAYIEPITVAPTPQSVLDNLPNSTSSPVISNDASMKVLSWNIAGLRAKKGDGFWVHFLVKHHIIALQETWEPNDCFYLDGFVSFCKHAIPYNMGRAKGGLLLMFSLKLCYRAKLIDSPSPHALAVELLGKNLTILLEVNFYTFFSRTKGDRTPLGLRRLSKNILGRQPRLL